MTQIVIASFEITQWDAEVYDTEADGAALSQAVVGKTFSGDLVGTSTARLLTCVTEGTDGAGYVASERVTGRLGGREGSFVMQHGGLSGGGPAPRSFGSIVPDSGTGELRGLVGTCEFAHDEQGARVTIAYDLLGA